MAFNSSLIFPTYCNNNNNNKSLFETRFGPYTEKKTRKNPTCFSIIIIVHRQCSRYNSRVFVGGRIEWIHLFGKVLVEDVDRSLLDDLKVRAIGLTFSEDRRRDLLFSRHPVALRWKSIFRHQNNYILLAEN